MINRLLLILCFTLCASAYATENVSGSGFASTGENFILDDESINNEDYSVVNNQAVVIKPLQDSKVKIVVEEKENRQNWIYSVKDKYVSTMFAQWAKAAGYQLIWQATGDFEIQSSGVIKNSSFRSAVDDVLRSFKYTDSPLKAEWYQNNVVVITDF